MAIYSIGLKTTDTTINHSCVEIVTASNLAVKVLEIGLSQSTGTACEYGLVRTTGITGGLSYSYFQAEQNINDPTAKTQASITGGSPAIATVYLRRLATPATVGAGVIWTFPRGLVINVSSSIVIYNITASVTCDFWCVIDE